MKRFRVVASLLLSFALAACGGETAPESFDGTNETDVQGPDADGNFYVVGLAGAVRPGSAVSVVNDRGERVSVIADETGSWAAMLWSAMDKTVTVESEMGVVSAAATAPQLVNVNFASRTGLESVPGIGPTLAARILAHRANYGLFAEVDDLLAVTGIGPASLENMRPYIDAKIDINVATKRQLMVLPAIGEVKADAIVAYRTANGPYSAPSDLLLVISATDYEQVKDFVRAGEIASHPYASLVNVNVAGVDELMTLPGIGGGKAKAIVDYRANHGPYHTREDLLYVPGIGPSTLANIHDLVTVGVLDVKRGTFVAEGAWQYEAGSDVVGESFPKPVLVKFDRSEGNDLLVTFVGGGYCDGTQDCAPFTLKGHVVAESQNQFTYRLSGYMPAEGGNFLVQATAATEGTIGLETGTVQFTATRGDEIYRIALAGYRVME